MLNTSANRLVPVAEPLLVEYPGQHLWDRDVDVAVVGLGAAGN